MLEEDLLLLVELDALVWLMVLDVETPICRARIGGGSVLRCSVSLHLLPVRWHASVVVGRGEVDQLDPVCGTQTICLKDDDSGDAQRKIIKRGNGSQVGLPVTTKPSEEKKGRGHGSDEPENDNRREGGGGRDAAHNSDTKEKQKRTMKR